MALAFMKKAFKPFKMFPLRSKAVHGSIQGQNLAWTVVWVPNSVAEVGGSCFDSEGCGPGLRAETSGGSRSLLDDPTPPAPTELISHKVFID